MSFRAAVAVGSCLVAVVASGCSGGAARDATGATVPLHGHPLPTAPRSAGSHPPPTTNARQVLEAATGPPVAGECSRGLLYTDDGSVTPLLCSGDDVNVTAWDYFAPLHLAVLSLGRKATLHDVEAALCMPGPAPYVYSLPQDVGAYTLAKAYYGWKFPTDPTAQLGSGPDGVTCSNG